jgi:hypothetical protein
MKIELGSAIEVVPPKQKTLQKDVVKRRCKETLQKDVAKRRCKKTLQKDVANGSFVLKNNRVVFLVMML